MCSVFDTEDIVLKRSSIDVTWEVKHKVCSILDIVYLTLGVNCEEGEVIERRILKY